MSSDMKKQARALPALLQVGKNGLSDGFLAELKLLVEKRGMIKVRFLKSFVDAHAMDDSVALILDKLPVQAVLVTGNTAVFQKK